MKRNIGRRLRRYFSSPGGGKGEIFTVLEQEKNNVKNPPPGTVIFSSSWSRSEWVFKFFFFNGHHKTFGWHYHRDKFAYFKGVLPRDWECLHWIPIDRLEEYRVAAGYFYNFWHHFHVVILKTHALALPHWTVKLKITSDSQRLFSSICVVHVQFFFQLLLPRKSCMWHQLLPDYCHYFNSHQSVLESLHSSVSGKLAEFLQKF